ncbi:MAG: hypothetical protein ACK5L3_12200 [Oscillospiraceae bacterium]
MRTSTEVQFALFDVTAKMDAMYTAALIEPFCNLEDFRQDTPPILPKYATCEHKQFLLDGSFEMFPDTPAGLFWGLWTQSISNSFGGFTSPPMLVIDFSVAHSSMGLTLHFYPPTEEWCSALHIQWLGAAGESLASGVFSPDATAFYVSRKVENYRRIIITFRQTNKPHRRVKMTAIDFGVRLDFAGESIVKAKILEEIDLLAAQLTVNTLDLTLYSANAFFSILNPEGAFSVLQHKQQFIVIERLEGVPIEMGTFYLSDWANTSNTLADFTAVTTIGLLDGVSHLGGVYDTRADIFAAELLAGYQYELAPELAARPVKGYLPIGTIRTALQHFAFAIGAVVDCSRSDKIRVYPPPERPSSYIGYDRKFKGSKVTLKSLITGVTVTARSFSLGAEQKELFRENLDVGQHRITLTAPAHSFSATGAAIAASGPNYVDLQVSAAGEIVLQGREYMVGTTTTTVMASAVPANTEPNILTVDQATLVSPDIAVTIAARILDYYSKRYEQTFHLRVTAESLADTAIIETFGNEKLRGSIERLSLDLTGGFLADVKVVGTRLDTRWQFYAGEIWAGEESAL